MKKILITGGAGYIGSATAQFFLKKNFFVYIIDNFLTGKNFLNHKNCKYIKSDYYDKKTFKIIKDNNISTIIHLAGFIDSNESVFKPKKYLRNNYYNFKKFINRCEKLNVKKIIFSSSAAVYGNKKNFKLTSESSILKPISPYGKSKLLAEKFLIKKNIKAVILRYFNVAGPTFEYKFNQNHKSYKHILKKLLEIETSKKKLHTFTINGSNYKTDDGTCVRDFIHVQDIAKINYIFSVNNFKKHLILNCGSSIPTSVKFLTTEFVKKSKKKIKINVGPNREGDPAFLLSDNSKLKSYISIRLKGIKRILIDTFKYVYIKDTN